MRTIEEKKDTELFSSCLVFQVHFSYVRTDDSERVLNASGVTGAGRKVLITQAGQEGPILFLSLSSFSTSTTGR